MDWRYNGIWFDWIDADKQLKVDFKMKGSQLQLTNQEYLTTWYQNDKVNALSLIPASDKLLYLEINWCNLENFQGIEKYPNLKRLELHYCTKLISDQGILPLANTLEWLHINQSKKLEEVTEFDRLKELRVLCLNNCGPIPSIDFIRKLPNLIDFRFVDTNILDGDLTPLIEHPSLRNTGFLNKRHYNYSSEKIEELLDQKSNAEYKEFVYKGQFKTFKYC